MRAAMPPQKRKRGVRRRERGRTSAVHGGRGAHDQNFGVRCHRHGAEPRVGFRSNDEHARAGGVRDDDGEHAHTEGVL